MFCALIYCNVLDSHFFSCFIMLYNRAWSIGISRFKLWARCDRSKERPSWSTTMLSEMTNIESTIPVFMKVVLLINRCLFCVFCLFDRYTYLIPQDMLHRYTNNLIQKLPSFLLRLDC